MYMETAQTYSPDTGYGKRQTTAGQIHDVRFRTNGIVRKFERTGAGGWEARYHELHEILPFYIKADIGGEKAVIRGSLKYAATPAGQNGFSSAGGKADFSAAREEIISHGRSYRGRHVKFRNPHEIPEIIYGSFSSKSIRLYGIRTIID